jgi:hypothetical protein
MGARNKAPQSFNPNQSAASICGKDLRTDGSIFRLQLANALPGPHILNATNGKSQLTVFVFIGQDKKLTGLIRL